MEDQLIGIEKRCENCVNYLPYQNRKGFGCCLIREMETYPLSNGEVVSWESCDYFEKDSEDCKKIKLTVKKISEYVVFT